MSYRHTDYYPFLLAGVKVGVLGRTDVKLTAVADEIVAASGQVITHAADVTDRAEAPPQRGSLPSSCGAYTWTPDARRLDCPGSNPSAASASGRRVSACISLECLQVPTKAVTGASGRSSLMRRYSAPDWCR